MSKFNVWMEGYSCTGEYAGATFLGTMEGESFVDAVKRWYNSSPNAKDYGELRVSDGVPSLWGCRLFDNEGDARKSFG